MEIKRLAHQELPREEKVDRIVAEATRQHPTIVKNLGEAAIRQRANFFLDQVEAFENAAVHYQLPNPEQAKKAKIYWDKSGHGTVLNLHKKDPWITRPWATGFDMIRFKTAIWWLRQIAEVKSGQKLTKENPDQIKNLIAQHAPILVYAGSSPENTALRQALKDNIYPIPREKVFIIDTVIDNNGIEHEITNTHDQVRSFKLPPRVTIEPGDEILIGVHAEQFPRLLSFLYENPDVIPKGAIVRALPIASPLYSETERHLPGESARDEFARYEFCGLLYHQEATPPRAAKSLYQCYLGYSNQTIGTLPPQT